tara:strand:+ start:8092 stop:8622 length:531 start_codon:yes stop_codon:yes gene_type:complete
MTKMKTKRNIVRISTLATSLATAAALPASANDWKAWEGQDQAAPRAIYSDATDQQSVLLTCGPNGLLSAMITVKPASLPEQLAKNAPYSRGEKASLIIGDADAVETKVRVIPAIDVIEARSHSIAAKVFNSAVMGVPLKMSVDRTGDIETLLPKPNDAFKAFARTCEKSRAEHGKS